MRNAKDSALNRYAVKNGRNRDGNEKVRKGLGCTNRSVRMDYFPGSKQWTHGRNGGCDGNPQRHPTANKIARQEPLFPFHEDGDPNARPVCTWEWYGFFDRRQQRKEPIYYVIDGQCFPITETWARKVERRSSEGDFIKDAYGVSYSC